MPSYPTERESALEKHRVRRAAFVAAAADVMRRDGVAACSVRAVARQAGVSPGVIHYYFADAQELVDLGYNWITDRYFAGLERFRHTHKNPTSDFWHFMAAYIEPWHTHPRMTQLWTEYYTFSGSNQSSSGIALSHQRTIELFASFLQDIEDGEYVERAPAVWRYVTGTVENRQTMPITLQQIFNDLARLIGLKQPTASRMLCKRDGCWCRGGASRLFQTEPQTSAS